MPRFFDTPERYSLISRSLHWGMALLFAMQFVTSATRWALPREDPIREFFWAYHAPIGTTLFLLVLLRGLWGLINMHRRPAHGSGLIGRMARVGHLAIYALMVIVPTLRLIAAAGSTRGFSYLGVEIFAARETEIAWMDAMAEWHGELGWILGLLVLGHIAMAVGWHHFIKRDGTLQRMT
ncbi:cytochrome b [Roseobacter denitrificans]|uniref:Cytochrome b561, putative n=1 Tax=Roseobacter denitrificans (strain ATCC 33942 / OCh 114) TaxID=375451 RepID=Q162G5_ROSDO|nr:cytochrome b [Roseobacter denitrificans]ABG33128.1 cytochrome b561, putative [Roseobacter denitrificans OCh 114]AVL52494.1 cytochrome b [Roseobacter denitrificans]SFG07443.1 cytochrome b561 [Roseobacter denitrificans OCh 114]